MGIRNESKAVLCHDPSVGVTEHIVSSRERLVAVLNQTPSPKTVELEFSGGFNFDSHISASLPSEAEKTGSGARITLPADTGCVLVLKK